MIGRFNIWVVAASLAIGGAASAQAPTGTPSNFDQNRIPAYGPGSTGGASYQSTIPSFPPQVQPNVGPIQQYQPPRPGLSPYLNLTRGANTGFGAVDYYNFVRPAQQANQQYVGRPYGPYGGFGGRFNVDPDVQLDSDSVLRSAGTPTAFMNYGRYFNSMGTIGVGYGRGQSGRTQTSNRR